MNKKLNNKKNQPILNVIYLGFTLLATCETGYASDSNEMNTKKSYSFSETVVQSVTGDVYSDAAAANWEELSYVNLFNKGWDKPWISPPTGGGGAPRQGWLNAYDGVFYRLSVATFGWQHGDSGDGYSGNLISYTPLSERFEVQTEIPMASGAGSNGQTNFGDFRITPRVILSESRDTTQSFNVTFRTPTGNSNNGNSVAAIAPQYNFWTNPWHALVVRGGVGFSIPYAGEIAKAGARSTFDANVAVGYYITPHNAAPFGDMVWYLSTNVSQPIDNRAPTSNTFVSLTPGFRTHLGRDWYLLGAVEVPVTSNPAYDYQVMGGIMKVY